MKWCIKGVTCLVILVPAAACASTDLCLLARATNSSSVEYGAILTEFGVFFARQEGRWGSNGRSRLYAAKLSGQSLQITFGAPDASESDPAYDASRRRLCFVSTRAAHSRETRQDGDIWCTDRKSQGWGPAYRLPEPVNSSAEEFSPSFDGTGRLFFASDRPGGRGQGDIYVAEESAEGGWQVANVGDAVNSAAGEWNVGVDASGTRLIFEASSRHSNRSNPGDLYFSRATPDGWSHAVPLSRLNSSARTTSHRGGCGPA